MNDPPGDVTVLLHELKLGNKSALDSLMPLIYTELRRLAGHYLRAERAGHILQPTALVHETYLRLAQHDHTDWQNRAHFLGRAAQIMRRILVDNARARATAKRGGGAIQMNDANFDVKVVGARSEEILAVNQALDRLAALYPQQARVVELRYFAGLTIEETAEAIGISPSTVKRDWMIAAVWLRSELSRSAGT
jgi:RNA polymerase sigma factor (TIGR02999 family)